MALAVRELVRTDHETAVPVPVPVPTPVLRVLLVICRPAGGQDVPFASVASRLVRAGIDRLPTVEVHVLRPPPTFARLAQVLQDAHSQGRPFGVVHFDGHGDWLDATTLTPNPTEASPADPASPGTPGTPNSGSGGVPGCRRCGRGSPSRGRHARAGTGTWCSRTPRCPPTRSWWTGPRWPGC